MNIDNLNRLIETLRNPPAASRMGFNLSAWHSRVFEGEETHVSYECGTFACIAGWSAYLADYELSMVEYDISDIASDWLGLDPQTARELFTPAIHVTYTSITREDAILVLSHLRDTGEVDWSIIAETRS